MESAESLPDSTRNDSATNAVVPPDVAERVDRFLRLLDEVMPDVVSGLHVIGSVALGDYRPGRSDIDVVVVTRRPLGEADVPAVDEVHRREHDRAGSGGPLAASYLTTSSLATIADSAVPIVSHLEGVTQYGPNFEVNPVTWRTLVRHAIAVRGNSTSGWMREPKDDTVADFCRKNLAEYWAPQLRDVDRAAEDDHDQRLRASALEWMALGPARSAHTIETGEVISKTRAGELMVERVSDIERPAFELALAARRGELDPTDEVPIGQVALAARAIERTILEPLIGPS